MRRSNKRRKATTVSLVAANAARKEKKLERDAQKAALADRIAKIKEMPTESTLDLKDLLSGDIGCSCSECGPNGRGGSNGLISPEMLKAKGALSKKGPAVDTPVDRLLRRYGRLQPLSTSGGGLGSFRNI